MTDKSQQTFSFNTAIQSVQIVSPATATGFTASNEPDGETSIRNDKSYQFPLDWTIRALRCSVTINYGRSPAPILDTDGLYPVVGTGGKERLGNAYLYDGNSIILGRKGTIDRVYFASGKFWTIDTAYYLSRFVETVPRWLYYFLQSLDLRQMNEATGVPSLSRTALYAIQVPTPPETEQTKIAEILSAVDRAIEQTEALIAKQQRIKTGLMQDLLTRGIDEQGNIRSESTHEFRDSDLGRIPAQWTLCPIGKLCSRIVDCPHSTPNYLDSGIPCIRTADLQPGNLVLNNAFCVDEQTYRKRIARLTPTQGDIIYSREGERLGIASPVGNTRLCLGQRVMLLRANDYTDPAYLLWVMNDPSFYFRISAGLGATTSPHVNVADVQAALVRKPSQAEQIRIGRILQNQHEDILNNISRLSKMHSLKTALMKDLLTGKKRVTPLLSSALAQ